jgi:hypothetical protein
MYVFLRAQIDAEVGERRLERGEHPVAREGRVPVRAAQHPSDVPAFGVGEGHSDALAEQPVGDLLVQLLGRGEEGSALAGDVVE